MASNIAKWCKSAEKSQKSGMVQRKKCRPRQELSDDYLVFTCKIWLRYSRERASYSLINFQALGFNFHRGSPSASGVSAARPLAAGLGPVRGAGCVSAPGFDPARRYQIRHQNSPLFRDKLNCMTTKLLRFT